MSTVGSSIKESCMIFFPLMILRVFVSGKIFMKYIMETNYLETQVTMELRSDFARCIS